MIPSPDHPGSSYEHCVQLPNSRAWGGHMHHSFRPLNGAAPGKPQGRPDICFALSGRPSPSHRSQPLNAKPKHISINEQVKYWVCWRQGEDKKHNLYKPFDDRDLAISFLVECVKDLPNLKWFILTSTHEILHLAKHTDNQNQAAVAGGETIQ